MEILKNLPGWVTLLPMIFTGIVLLASIVVRFTKTEADDKAVGSIRRTILQALQMFPTIGINPTTKKLKEALEKIEAGSDKNPPSNS